MIRQCLILNSHKKIEKCSEWELRQTRRRTQMGWRPSRTTTQYGTIPAGTDERFLWEFSMKADSRSNDPERRQLPICGGAGAFVCRQSTHNAKPGALAIEAQPSIGVPHRSLVFRMTRAGTPATTLLSGTSRITTAFAPITTLFPTLTSPITLQPVPN